MIQELTQNTNKLVEVVKGLTGAFDNYQKATTSIGVSFKDATDILAPAMEDLAGSFNTRFAAGLEALSAGLGTNSKGVIQLLNEQKLTNQNSKVTAKLFRDLQTTFGMSTEALNNLASKTTELANSYGMTSTALLKAVENLKQSQPVALLTGMSDQLVEATASLTSSFGPGMQNEVTKFINTFLDPSFENMNKLALLGIEDMRERLVQAKTAGEAEALLRQAILKASQRVNSFGEAGEQSYRQTQLTMAILGKDGANIAALAQQMDRRQRTEAENLAVLGQDFQTMIDNIVTPFQTLMMQNLLPALQEFVAGGMPAFKKVAENLAIFTGSFFTDFHKTWELSMVVFEMTLKKALLGLVEMTPFKVSEETKTKYISSQLELATRQNELFKELKRAHQQRQEEAQQAALDRHKGLQYQEEALRSTVDLGPGNTLQMTGQVLANTMLDVISGNDDSKLDTLIALTQEGNEINAQSMTREVEMSDVTKPRRR